MKKSILIITCVVALIGCVKPKNIIQFTNSDKEISNSEIDRLTEIYSHLEAQVMTQPAGDGKYKISSGSSLCSDSLTINIANNEFKSELSTVSGNCYIVDQLFTDNSLFGSTVSFSVSTSNGKSDYSYYVPKKISISHPNSTVNMHDVKCNRTGNTITWDADKNNKGGILLVYTLYDNNDLINKKVIQHSFMTIADDGSFNADSFFTDEKVKGLFLSLQRGNAINHTLPSGKKLTIDFITSTSKELYLIN
tara:strand:- start:931 stop:1680 length:750 start_codon:yes stop_codon:yes gene_type:complete